jgi:hypothetical protein
MKEDQAEMASDYILDSGSLVAGENAFEELEC